VLKTFADLSTPLVADACLRRDVPLLAAPPGVRTMISGHGIAGRALPARHYGRMELSRAADRLNERPQVRAKRTFVNVLLRAWKPRLEWGLE
jgi:hypothetical protein